MKMAFKAMWTIGSLMAIAATPLMATDTVPQSVDPTAIQQSATVGKQGGDAANSAKASAVKATRLDEVVVTATKYETSMREVPASVTVITGKQLAAQNLPHGDIVDALRSVSGVTLQRAYDPFPASLNIRGATSSGTMVLVNGVPSNWEITQAITPENVERIEIMRGPASALYGANATGGVINIITKQGGDSVQSNLGYSYGSFNTWRFSGASSGSLDKFHYSVAAAREGSDGTNIVRNNVSTGVHMIDDCPYDKLSASVATSYDLPENGKLSHLYNYYHDRYVRGRPNVEGDWNRHFTSLILDQPLGERFIFKGSVGYRYDDLIHLTDKGGTNFMANQRRKTAYTEMPVELQLTSNLGWGNVVTMGYFGNSQTSDIRYKNPNGTLVGDQEYKVRTQAGYIQDVWTPIDPLTITLGVRGDKWENIDTYYYSFVNKKPADRTESNWSPKVGVKYNFADSTAVWASYATGFLAPTPDQLYDDRTSGGARRQANPNLKAETSRAYEAGVERWFAEKFNARLVGFYNTADDKILSWYNTTDLTWYNENIGRSKAYGYEVDLRYVLDHNWAFSANYTSTKATIDKNPTKLYQEGNDLTYTPKHMANLGVTYSQPESLDLSVFARYMSEQHTNDDNARYTALGEQQSMPASFTVDLKGTKHIALNRGSLKKMDVSLSIDNLLNTDYRTNFVYEDPGTVATLETKLFF